MLRKGEQVIKTMLSDVDKGASKMADELLFSLNDSHGIAPEMAISLAQKFGLEINDFEDWIYCRIGRKTC